MSKPNFTEKYGLRQKSPGPPPRPWPGMVSDSEEESTEEDPTRQQRLLTEHRNRERLFRKSSEFTKLLDDKIFIADNLAFLASKLNGSLVGVEPLQINDYGSEERQLSVDEKIRNIEIRMKDVHLTRKTDINALEILCGLILSRPLDVLRGSFPEPKTPEVLYRAFWKGSHTRYDEVLGFRSSNQPMARPDFTSRTIKDAPFFNQDVLTNQCEGTNPSDLIALTDHPRRALNIIESWKHKDRDGINVAVISVAKLIRMGVLFQCTSTLAEHLKMPIWRRRYRESGLGYVNDNYWVAYRWIPAQCIECYISTKVIQDLCDESIIGKKVCLCTLGTIISTYHNVPADNEYNKRFSMGELSAQLSLLGCDGIMGINE